LLGDKASDAAGGGAVWNEDEAKRGHPPKCLTFPLRWQYRIGSATIPWSGPSPIVCNTYCRPLVSMQEPGLCQFCSLPDTRIVLRDDGGVVIRDGFPVSPGHTLVIPQRHVESLFELESTERSALMDLLARARTELEREFRPDGYNIGINDGRSAGQTVMHLHIHLIPRFEGDAPDPRGGVRWVMPDKAKYWQP
jgi:diadenosine tetraphosphate (Ap4A) HIT family hydrolase